MFKYLISHFMAMVGDERGMADASLTTISPILQKVIHPILQRVMSKKVIFLDQVKKNVRTTIANNTIYISVAGAYHSGFYFVAEGTAPKVGRGSYIQPYAAMKYGFLTFGFTDQALTLAAKAGKQAIAGTFDAEFQTGVITAAKHMNRIFHGMGDGRLCVANGLGNTTKTLTVDGCPAAGGTGNHTKYLAPGQTINIGSTEAVIDTVDSATQVTLVDNETWDDDAVITLADDAEPMGLAGHLDDGDNVSTYQGLTRSSYPGILYAQVDDDAEALTEADMVALVVKAREFGDGPSVGLCNQTLWNKYGALLLSMKRNTDTKPVLGGGWAGLELNAGGPSIPIICDYDAWDTYVQFPNFKNLTIAEASDMWEWMGAYERGGVLRRSPDNRTAWEGTQKWYCNMVALQNNDQARMKGKTA